MYGQYSVHVLQIHFEFQIFIAIVYVYLTRWRSIRYYCSSNSNHLVQIESWTRCDVWTIFSTHFINTLWVWNFHCNCICIFNSMKIYQILLQLRLKFLVQIENWIYCDAWTIFSTHFINTLWVWNFHWYCIYMIHFNEDFLDTFAAPIQTI